MKQKSYMAATLAILSMLGFLAILAALIFVEVPEDNRIYFGAALQTLFGCVCIAFGYYLGSSSGSSRKTELLGGPALPGMATEPGVLGEQPNRLGQAGFARFSLLMVLLAVAFVAVMCTLNGCASMRKEPPEIVAGKSLLAMKTTIVTAATTGDQLCRKKLIPEADCRTLATWYLQAQPAYDLAVDSMTLVLLSRDKTLWQRYQADQAPFRRLYDDFIIMSGRYGLLGGAQ